MHRLKSLREYVAALKALGEVQEIDVEVDWDLEMGAIMRRAYETRAAAPLFNCIKGCAPGFRVLGAPAGMSGVKGRELTRVALSLGLRAESTGRQLVEAMAGAHAMPPIKPVRVETGPCKQNILIGDQVDLWKLPTPLIHPGDGGRYLNTWGTVIVQTPDGQWTNWSISRAMIIGPRKLAGLVLPQQHIGIIYAQWKAIGRDMSFALAMGTEPVLPFVAGMPIYAGVNEADFIGGYLGEPLEVVDCKTVPLRVPSTAEIVVEGTISISETAIEGPMGEYSGYLAPAARSPRPVFNVSAMTHRDNAILPVVAAGEPIEENHT